MKKIKVDLNKIIKKVPNFWNHIMFHPTDAIEDDWGRKILDQVAEDKVAKCVRIYAMFEDIFSLDENGNLIFDYSLNDYRLDYLVSKEFKPLIIYAYMPEFLASIKNSNSVVAHGKTRYKGKTINVSLPTDFEMWKKLCLLYTKHIAERYGIEEVSSWRFECWNEPDCHLFFMPGLMYSFDEETKKANEYFKLYSLFAKSVKSVNKKLLVGGPAHAFDLTFLDRFLYLIKENDIDFDFFSFHTYGTDPNKLNSGEENLNVINNINKMNITLNVYKKYFNDKEVIMDEWGAAAWGFFNLDDCKKLEFRENHEFAVYFGKLIIEIIKRDIRIDKMMICLSGQHELKTEFSGYRGFFTLSGIKKPVYNAYALASFIKENVLLVENKDGISTLITKDNCGNVNLLICYSDDNFNEKLIDQEIEFDFGENCPFSIAEQFVIDANNLNPFEQFKNVSKDTVFSDEEISKMRKIATPVAKNVELTNDGKIIVKITDCSFNIINLIK